MINIEQIKDIKIYKFNDIDFYNVELENNMVITVPQDEGNNDYAVVKEWFNKNEVK